MRKFTVTLGLLLATVSASNVFASRWDTSIYGGPVGVGFAMLKPVNRPTIPALYGGMKAEAGYIGSSFYIGPQGILRFYIPVNGDFVVYPQVGLGAVVELDGSTQVKPIGSIGFGVQFSDRWGMLVQVPALPVIAIVYRF